MYTGVVYIDIGGGASNRIGRGSRKSLFLCTPNLLSRQSSRRDNLILQKLRNEKLPAEPDRRPEYSEYRSEAMRNDAKPFFAPCSALSLSLFAQTRSDRFFLSLSLSLLYDHFPAIGAMSSVF